MESKTGCNVRFIYKTCIRIFSFFIFCTIVNFLYQDSKRDVAFIYKHVGHAAPCVIPQIDPFDPKMMEFVRNPGPLVCQQPPVVYVSSNNVLQFNETTLKMLNEKPENVKCNIYLVKRLDDDIVEYSKPLPWKPPDRVPSDFFKIKCQGSKGILVDNFLTSVVKKPTKFNNLTEQLEKSKFNVLLFGLDSLSRSAGIRQLPKTYKFLTETLGGFDFSGYTKVASNTFVNMVPLLTGRFLYKNELPDIDFINEYLDWLPLIWKNFSAENSATMFVEDFVNLNMFNMAKKGFEHAPTDHYMRPFWRAIKLSKYFYNQRADLGRFFQSAGITLKETPGLCHGERPNHVVVMDYIKQFLTAYKDSRKFLMSFLTELGHEYQNLMQLGDEDITTFFTWLHENSFLNNTVLIMFSDHGMRFGNVQHLYVGRIENRMPFLSIVLPRSLRDKHPEAVNNLRINQGRLTTPFDLHATLRDLLDGNLDKPRHFSVNNKLRGISLFKEIPEDRSCADAFIDEDICPCHKSTKLNITNNPLADDIARAVLNHINLALRSHKMCAKLTLSKIMELSKNEEGLKHISSIRTSWFNWKNQEVELRDDTRHSIVLETSPGNGRFYATCDVFSNSTIKVYGNIDRVNKYGNQSSCINEQKLKHLCYCLESRL